MTPPKKKKRLVAKTSPDRVNALKTAGKIAFYNLPSFLSEHRSQAADAETDRLLEEFAAAGGDPSKYATLFGLASAGGTALGGGAAAAVPMGGVTKLGTALKVSRANAAPFVGAVAGGVQGVLGQDDPVKMLTHGVKDATIGGIAGNVIGEALPKLARRFPALGEDLTNALRPSVPRPPRDLRGDTSWQTGTLNDLADVKARYNAPLPEIQPRKQQYSEDEVIELLRRYVQDGTPPPDDIWANADVGNFAVEPPPPLDEFGLSPNDRAAERDLEDAAGGTYEIWRTRSFPTRRDLMNHINEQPPIDEFYKNAEELLKAYEPPDDVLDAIKRMSPGDLTWGEYPPSSIEARAQQRFNESMDDFPGNATFYDQTGIGGGRKDLMRYIEETESQFPALPPEEVDFPKLNSAWNDAADQAAMRKDNLLPPDHIEAMDIFGGQQLEDRYPNEGYMNRLDKLWNAKHPDGPTILPPSTPPAASADDFFVDDYVPPSRRTIGDDRFGHSEYDTIDDLVKRMENGGYMGQTPPTNFRLWDQVASKQKGIEDTYVYGGTNDGQPVIWPRPEPLTPMQTPPSPRGHSLNALLAALGLGAYAGQDHR